MNRYTYKLYYIDFNEYTTTKNKKKKIFYKKE